MQGISSRKVMGLGILGLSGYIALLENKQQQQLKRQYLELLEKVSSQEQAYQLTSLDHVEYPWVHKNTNQFSYKAEDDWECKRVKIRGYF